MPITYALLLMEEDRKAIERFNKKKKALQVRGLSGSRKKFRKAKRKG